MSESAPMLSPMAGASDEQLKELLARGKQRGSLSLDDVLDVLRHVELTPDVYERVRRLLDDAGISLDESLDAIEPTPPTTEVRITDVVTTATVVDDDAVSVPSVPESELQTVIVDSKGRVTMTPGLRGRAHLTP